MTGGRAAGPERRHAGRWLAQRGPRDGVHGVRALHARCQRAQVGVPADGDPGRGPRRKGEHLALRATLTLCRFSEAARSVSSDFMTGNCE